MWSFGLRARHVLPGVAVAAGTLMAHSVRQRHSTCKQLTENKQSHDKRTRLARVSALFQQRRKSRELHNAVQSFHRVCTQRQALNDAGRRTTRRQRIVPLTPSQQNLCLISMVGAQRYATGLAEGKQLEANTAQRYQDIIARLHVKHTAQLEALHAQSAADVQRTRSETAARSLRAMRFLLAGETLRVLGEARDVKAGVRQQALQALERQEAVLLQAIRARERKHRQAVDALKAEVEECVAVLNKALNESEELERFRVRQFLANVQEFRPVPAHLAEMENVGHIVSTLQPALDQYEGPLLPFWTMLRKHAPSHDYGIMGALLDSVSDDVLRAGVPCAETLRTQFASLYLPVATEVAYTPHPKDGNPDVFQRMMGKVGALLASPGIAALFPGRNPAVPVRSLNADHDRLLCVSHLLQEANPDLGQVLQFLDCCSPKVRECVSEFRDNVRNRVQVTMVVDAVCGYVSQYNTRRQKETKLQSKATAEMHRELLAGVE